MPKPTSMQFLAMSFGLLALSSESQGAPSEGAVWHIVSSRRVVSAGESVDFTLSPPAPQGTRVSWGVARRDTVVTREQSTQPRSARQGPSPIEQSSAGTVALRRWTYRAPYVVQPGTPAVKIVAVLSGPGLKTQVETEVELTPGSVPGVENCLGPGQSFLATAAGLDPEFTQLDESPELIHKVDPVYPRSALARGIEAEIVINALVCRTGYVIDAQYAPAYRNPGDDQPIEVDPKLIEAGIAAVKQDVFKPGVASGQPMACWVAVPLRFGQP